MTASLPKGWKRARIADVADVTMGQSPPSESVNLAGHGLPFIQGNAEFGVRHPSPEKWCSSPPKKANLGDILISVRAPVGEMNIAAGDICIGRGLASLKAVDVSHDFLWHALRVIRSQLDKVSQGSTFQAVSSTDLAALEILLPPLPEQRRIAEILTGVDDAIDATRSVIDQTRKLKAALLQYLLSNGIPGRHTTFKTVKLLGRIPAEWEVVRLGDIVEDGGLQTGPFGGQLHASDYSCEGIPVVMPVNMRNGKIDTTEIARVSPDHVERLGQHRIKAGDIVFARRGDIGRCALVTASQEGWLCGTGCLRGRPSYGVVSEYLLHYLGQELVIQWLNDNAVGQTMLNLSTGILAGLPIALPTHEEQRVIGNAIVLLEEQIAQQRNWLSGLQSSKGALSHALLAGRI